MKKFMMVLVSGVLVTTLATNLAIAQPGSDMSYVPKKKPSIFGAVDHSNPATMAEDNKAAVKSIEANLKTAKINLKVTDHVQSNFSNVSDLSFYAEDKLIIGTFKMGQKSSRVVYDEKGNWMYSVTSYGENQLPENIRSLAKRNYGKFKIALVQEVRQGEVQLYKIHLENATTLKQILVHNDDEIIEYANYNKNQ